MGAFHPGVLQEALRDIDVTTSLTRYEPLSALLNLLNAVPNAELLI